MNMIKITRSLFLLFSIAILFTACDKENVDADDFGIFSSQDSETVIIEGLIDSDIPQYWDNYIAAFPETNRMIMKDCPGSTDDDANWAAARKIRAQDIAIHLPADADIASGAVDLFLSGTTRTREAGSKIGVHAWADGAGNEATDFPVGDVEHQGAIDYYIDMGFSQEDAEAFYYFTINAAAAADIHYMTDAEIEQYKLLTE